MLLRRYKGMIYPDFYTAFEGAEAIANRKSIWMVEYLRARRSGDRLIGFYRKSHLSSKEPKA